MENATTGFKYAVGDLVCLKVQYQEYMLFHGAKVGLGLWEKGYITPIQINERMYQECSGGVQRQYNVRVNQGAGHLWIHEHELLPWNEVVNAVEQSRKNNTTTTANT